LIELIVALTVLAIVATAGIPSFLNLVDRHQLRGAANALYSDLLFARMEAIHRQAPVSVSFQTDGAGGHWCHGLSDSGPCDCRAGDECTLAGAPPRITQGSDFRRVALATNFTPAATVTFHPARGTANSGTTRLTTAAGAIDVVVSSLGRVRMCSTQIPDFPPC
jgi:Tfp pilus assembly protein FimT